MRRALVGVALVAALAGLAGCGGTVKPGAPQVPREPTAAGPAGPAGSAGSSGSGSPVPVPAPVPSSDDVQLSELAQLAEQQSQVAPSSPGDGVPVLGADVSWPQCPKGLGIPEKRTLGAPLPLDTARYVVVGLTNGPGFYANPCLADQVAFVRDRGLLAAAYSVVSYPDALTLAAHGGTGPFDGGTVEGALQNTGYQQATFNIASMTSTGLMTPIVWLDVEHVPDFDWSDNPAANAAVVVGAARGYTDAGYRVGVYSTPFIWAELVGDLTLGVPEWRAAGQTSRAEALSRCGDDWVIQGGPSVLGQWVEAGRDQNVTCPGVAGELGQWFHQY